MSVRHETPPGYPVSSLCTVCGRDFVSDTLFFAHKTGSHEYLYSEGLKMEPPREDGRRCLDEDEMRERGWRPMSDEEMLAAPRQRKRAGFGVELWFDPVGNARLGKAFPHPATKEEA